MEVVLTNQLYDTQSSDLFKRRKWLYVSAGCKKNPCLNHLTRTGIVYDHHTEETTSCSQQKVLWPGLQLCLIHLAAKSKTLQLAAKCVDRPEDVR